MAEVMLGKELHPDRVIQVEKLYEIFNKCGIPYSFAAQHGIENNAFAVVRCRECKHLNVLNHKELYAHCPKTNTVFLPFELDTREHFCSLGERKEGVDNG